MLNKLTINACLIGIIGVLLAVIVALVYFDRGQMPSVFASRERGGGYQFTNPILDYEEVKMYSSVISTNKVWGKFAELKQKHGVSFASVYFRDLNNGQWIGVNEKEPFVSASLIKLPIFLSYLKQTEHNSELANKSVKVLEEDRESDLEQNIKPLDPVSIGSSYSLQELVRRMIIDSDNVATQAVLRSINLDRQGVFKSIGVDYEDTAEREVEVNVKNYAAFFRVLFNSTYLEREASEYALKTLSQVNFKDGLVAGVPAEVRVAHKFGERGDYINGMMSSVQLHDCGIIYYPDFPYILCVMTRGRDIEHQESFISDVSRYFYDEIARSLESTRGNK